MFLPHFDVFCDLLLNITVTLALINWNTLKFIDEVSARKSYVNFSIILTFSRDQYISPHYLNTNLQIKGTFDPSFHAREKTVYNKLQSSTSSDKEQEG